MSPVDEEVPEAKEQKPHNADEPNNTPREPVEVPAKSATESADSQAIVE